MQVFLGLVEVRVARAGDAIITDKPKQGAGFTGTLYAHRKTPRQHDVDRGVALRSDNMGAEDAVPYVACIPGASAQFFLEQIIHLLRIRLAFGRFHDLANE